jgi:hypothetical protein
MKQGFWKWKVTAGIGNNKESAYMACLINPISQQSLDYAGEGQQKFNQPTGS